MLTKTVGVQKCLTQLGRETTKAVDDWKENQKKKILRPKMHERK